MKLCHSTPIFNKFLDTYTMFFQLSPYFLTDGIAQSFFEDNLIFTLPVSEPQDWALNLHSSVVPILKICISCSLDIFTQ